MEILIAVGIVAGSAALIWLLVSLPGKPDPLPPPRPYQHEDVEPWVGGADRD